MMEPCDRLRIARERLYPSAEAAAEVHQWSADTLRSHENGNRKFTRKVEEYARAFRVPAGWLLTGESPPSWFKENSATIKELPTRQAPLLSYAELGIASLEGGDELRVAPGTKYMLVPSDPPLGKRIACLQVEDDSMTSPSGISFDKGDIIVVDLGAPPSVGDLVIAIRDKEGQPVFRKYQEDEDENGEKIVLLVPLNRAHAKMRIDSRNPGRIIGRVVMHTRRF